MEVEVLRAMAVNLTRTARAMIASEGSAPLMVVGALLLPGYGLSFPSASAAFVSVQSSPSSGGAVRELEDSFNTNNLTCKSREMPSVS